MIRTHNFLGRRLCAALLLAPGLALIVLFLGSSAAGPSTAEENGAQTTAEPEPPQSAPATPPQTSGAPPPAASLPDEDLAPPTQTGPGILWRPWSFGTLEAARDVDRPILMFLSNPWNTLGAIMDANTFHDPRVVGVARELFVPVRVDVDRRPDVEERYGAGGPPSVAILMPSGESMYLKTPKGHYVRAAGTYLSADEMYHFLLSVADYFKNNRQILDLRITDIMDRFQKAEKVTVGPLDETVLDTVASALHEQFDRTHGGFGMAPKVPDAQSLLLCWYLARARGESDARDMGLRTVRAIWNSPLHDAVDGGVFRIATERDWTGPRYEKGLDVNARLLEAMADGVLVTEDRWLAEAVHEQANFLIDKFVDPEGGFKRAQGPGDANGTYFKLSRRERRKAEAPPIESTRIVSWNAHAVSGLLRAYQALGEERYRETALAALDFLLSRCQEGSRGMVHVNDGRALMGGLLVDQVATLRVLVEAHQVTGQARYLASALEILSVIHSFFRDPDSPRLLDRARDPRAPGAMARPDRDLVDNCELALALLDLHALTGSTAYAEEARLILQAFVEKVQVYGVYASPLARAVDRALREPLLLVVSAGGQPDRARELARAAAFLPQPWTVVVWPDGRAMGGRRIEGEEDLRSAGGAAAFLSGQGRRSGILRAPEEIAAAARGWTPEPARPAAGSAARSPQSAPAGEPEVGGPSAPESPVPDRARPPRGGREGDRAPAAPQSQPAPPSP